MDSAAWRTSQTLGSETSGSHSSSKTDPPPVGSLFSPSLLNTRAGAAAGAAGWPAGLRMGSTGGGRKQSDDHFWSK